ncbi:zingipain-1 [Selaginella moellendorffii]|uniref:zingipain-1 n=1 Tax=Selaginella moellendorffii TaxID=88036 RepID=UPI000D1C67F1|nr:zingipain-1 [Selaginella moellendorffii]|eukprot:XP_024529729.1 zingipain-1 [Selaginella moellendorffii]
MSLHPLVSISILLLLLAADPNAASDTNPNGNAGIRVFGDVSSDPPKSMDWRRLGAVTPVKDRKGCQNGSWAFAAAEAIEGINKIATGVLVELSAQQLLDCSRSYGTDGCHSGFPQNAFEYLVDTGNGLSTASDYRFTGFNGTCRKHNRYAVGIDNYDNFYSSSDDTEIVKQVAKQPVTALIDGNAPEFHRYKGGIYKGPCKDEQATPYLAVLIVGYGSENGQDYWIIKNSAGTNWGEKGYMRLQRGNHGLPLGRCGVNGFVYFPVKAKVPSPPSPPPPSPPPPPRPRPSPPPSPPVPCYKRIHCGFTGIPCCFSWKAVCCPMWKRCTFSGCA